MLFSDVSYLLHVDSLHVSNLLEAPIALNMLLEMLIHSCFQLSYHKISVFFFL